MIHAVYNPLDGARPVLVSKSKSAVKDESAEDTRSYSHLTEKQVKLLTYTQATFMEMLLEEAHAKDLD